LKGRHVVLLIAGLIIVDQALKIYIKTHYYLGESHAVAGNWLRLYFVENEGMAYGWKLGGKAGKLLLTLFRLGAVIFGVYYINKIIKKKAHPGFIICASLIFAGALGNLIDSMFYGLIFNESIEDMHLVAKVVSPANGYAPFLQGKVVDMLYFPVINTHFPNWVPFVGGNEFRFFQPIFNLADASISGGVIALLLFQKKFFKNTEKSAKSTKEEVTTVQ
jgi:signal peptidase II